MTTKSKKPRVSANQKLRDALAYASSCLKEAGDPTHGRGPSAQYADAFRRYSDAMEALLKSMSPLHVSDWDWDGYNGKFTFRWDFSAQLLKPGCPEFDTRYVQMSTAAVLDDSAPLDDELDRLLHEAKHLDELRGVAMRWSREARSRDASERSELDNREP